MRAPQEAIAGEAQVRLAFEGWPQGDVQPSLFTIPVVPRKLVQLVVVSPRQRAVWRFPEHWQPRQLVPLLGGNGLIVASVREDKTGRTDRLALWDAAAGKDEKLLLELPPEGKLVHSIYKVKFSPDDRWLAAAVARQSGVRKNFQGDQLYTSSHRLYLFDMRANRIAWQVETEGASISGLDFSPDGQTVAAAELTRVDRQAGERTVSHWGGCLRVWDVATGKQRAKLASGNEEGPWNVAFSQDGRIIAGGYVVTFAGPKSYDNHSVLRLWDWTTQKLHTTLPDRSYPIFVPHSRSLLASGDHGQLIVTDLDSHRDRPVFSYDRSKQWLAQAWPMTGGRSVACQLSTERIVQIELSSGKILAQAGPDSPKNRLGSSAAQSRDGRLFAISDYMPARDRTSGTLKEDWDEVPPPQIHVLATAGLGKLTTLTGHVGRINDLGFSADGLTLFSAGGDGTIRLWDTEGLVTTQSK